MPGAAPAVTRRGLFWRRCRCHWSSPTASSRFARKRASPSSAPSRNVKRLSASARIRPRRRLRAVAAEPQMTQERVRGRNDRQLLIQHRPVPRTRRQPHHERTHPVIPRSLVPSKNNYQPRAPHPRKTAAKRRNKLRSPTSRNSPSRPRRNPDQPRPRRHVHRRRPRR
jgi:hypothetical protein